MINRIFAILAIAIALAFAPQVRAQAVNVPATATITWMLPTTTTDGVPLTGALALTGVEIYISTSPIADDSTLAPTAVLGGNATSTVQTLTVPNGSTLYVRAKAVRGAEKSAFSNQATKLVNVSTVPRPPTSVDIQLTITVQ